MNWDDLRIAQAIFQGGTFAAAAKRLSINETTVARRLSRLERSLGVILFEAVDGGRRPTAECREIVGLVDTMDLQVRRIAEIQSPDQGLIGNRRVATTDSIAAEVLAPHTVGFLAEHPGLSMDLLVSTATVNFSRWEADIAVRLARPKRGDFTISRIANIDLYLFEPVAVNDQESVVCTFPEDLADTPESQYLEKAGIQYKARIRTKNYLVIKRLILSGGCTAILPGFICTDLLSNPAYKVTRLPDSREVWMLVQRHLREDPATRAIIDWIKECFVRV